MAGGVLLLRLLPLGFRALERAARRGSLPVRLALLGVVRRPGAGGGGDDVPGGRAGPGAVQPQLPRHARRPGPGRGGVPRRRHVAHERAVRVGAGTTSVAPLTRYRTLTAERRRLHPHRDDGRRRRSHRCRRPAARHSPRPRRRVVRLARVVFKRHARGHRAGAREAACAISWAAAGGGGNGDPDLGTRAGSQCGHGSPAHRRAVRRTADRGDRAGLATLAGGGPARATRRDVARSRWGGRSPARPPARTSHRCNSAWPAAAG